MTDPVPSKDLLRDWLKFASDVTPSCAAGDELLRGLQQRTEAALRTPDEIERLQARCKDVETFIAAMGWKFDGECFGATGEPAADRGTTHADGCWGWGPKHYDCAVAEIRHAHEVIAHQGIQLWQAPASAQPPRDGQ